MKKENNTDPAARTARGKTAGLVGMISNTVLFALKILIGLLFGSISVIADAVNNLMDSLTSLVTIIGFKAAEKPADRQHPYGHARMEYISGLIISFTVLILGFQIGKSAVERILSPREAAFSILSLVVLLLAVLIKLWQSFYYRRIGKKIRSVTLEAAAADSMSDVISSAAVVLGAAVSKLTGFDLDGYIGLAVAVFIVISGVRLLISASQPLLGTAASPEFVKEISGKLLSYEGVLGIHDLTVHSYGEGKSFVCVHCEVSADKNVLESHDLMDRIERDFREEMQVELTIHMDPVITDDEALNSLREQTAALVREISPAFSLHDFRMVRGAAQKKLIFDVAVPFEYPGSADAVREEISRRIRETDETCSTVITVDRR